VALEPVDDAALLAATAQDPEAFGLFYRRHVRAVLAYLLSRTRRPELAADLCAETFATALEQAHRYDARRGPARAWLLNMACSRLIDSLRRVP
jgi:DNA-directed RNA polymerase specialized sigma24 family protein